MRDISEPQKQGSFGIRLVFSKDGRGAGGVRGEAEQAWGRGGREGDVGALLPGCPLLPPFCPSASFLSFCDPLIR